METKRILIAGFLMVTLYVAWSIFFGPQPGSAIGDNSLISEESPGFIESEEKEMPGPSQEDASSKDINSTLDDNQGVPPFIPITFSVTHDGFFNSRLSTQNGGTFLEYSLPSYLGAYSETKKTSRGGVSYDPNIPFEFLFTSDNGFPDAMLGCNPCIESLSSIERVVAKHNGQEITDGKELNLSGANDNTIVFEITLSGGEKATHEMTFNSDSYSVSHVYDNLPNEEHLVVWKNGIAPAERFAWEDNNNFCAGFVDVSGEEDWNEMNVDHNDLKSSFEVEWAGVRNKFFVTALIPISENIGATLSPVKNNLEQISKQYKDVYGRTETPAIHDIKIKFEKSEKLNFDTFLAPLDYSIISVYENQIKKEEDRDIGLSHIMTLGFWPLSEISKLISLTIQYLYAWVGFAGYGLILIIFAFLVRIISGPLTKRSLRATQKMQVIQPIIKDIQEKYKSDPKKMQMKIMQAYKENNVNPLSGCLLMFLQWPIMIPPFIIFRSAVELRMEGFLWIKDLSQPDYLISLPFDVPFLGTGEGWTGIGILPLLMGFTLYLTMKKTMSGAPGQNKMMMYVMNVMFVLLFNSFPAGLNLYYVCYNILNYLQQQSTNAKGSDTTLFSKLKGLLQKQQK
jgi:YidC/Oxa1 family membrane protein insertase